MENLVTMKIELDISAQKILNHMQMHNETIEKQIAKGIELAINDITDGDNFVEAVRESVKKEVDILVTQAMLKWDMKFAIAKMIEQKVGKKLEEYSDQLAQKIMISLNSNNPEP